MKMRIAFIGCGVVGSIHARHLSGQPDTELAAVYSPEPERAASFAAQYGVRAIVASAEEAIAAADVAVICSPSPVHFGQAQMCLDAGRHALIELPPCAEPREAEELGAIAKRRGVLVGCAHTSRFLAPYARIHQALRSGELGEVQEISCIRCPQLRPRTWSDNALVHHAAHVIDLALHWCGEMEPRACVAFPDRISAQSVSILATLPGGKPFTATITYGAKLAVSEIVVIGAKHTVKTDGFSYLHSDWEGLQLTLDERAVYEGAIAAQDTQFLDACRGKDDYVSWTETESLMRMIHRFQTL